MLRGRGAARRRDRPTARLRRVDRTWTRHAHRCAGGYHVGVLPGPGWQSDRTRLVYGGIVSVSKQGQGALPPGPPAKARLCNPLIRFWWEGERASPAGAIIGRSHLRVPPPAKTLTNADRRARPFA